MLHTQIQISHKESQVSENYQNEIYQKFSSQVFEDNTFEKLNTYISVFDGELDIISSLQSLQVTLELTVVKEDLLHYISPFNESKGLLKDNIWFSITDTKTYQSKWEMQKL